jgi:hypothetical protein
MLIVLGSTIGLVEFALLDFVKAALKSLFICKNYYMTTIFLSNIDMDHN